MSFKETLSAQLLQLARQKGLLPEGDLPISPDMEQMWTRLAPEFLADAVPEFNGYPEVVLAWAAYLGAAVAWGWDRDWEATLAKQPARTTPTPSTSSVRVPGSWLKQITRWA